MSRQSAKIIRDQPSETDLLDGASHRRCANALINAVEQISGRDGAIGLEGPWGAGKSTVIKLAQTDLANKSPGGHVKHFFFTFDLWLHQPDQLKLAFLEELVAWANDKKLIGDDKARRYMDEIGNREVTTRVENNRQLSVHGVLFVLLAPLLPIAYLWLGPNGGTAIPTFLGLQFSGQGLASVLLFALYGLFALTVLSGLKSGRAPTWLSALSAAARVFSKETDYDRITQNIRERNPTSETFQGFFRALLSDIQRNGDRVVIVFDNIDRLPTDTVSKVWSDTRSIFAMTGRGAQPSNSSVTAIVPYDATFVSQVFDHQRNDGSVSEHLLKKTFDITVRVAPPLSTDWRKFLDSKLKEAFPDQLTALDRYKLFKLFDLDNQERTGLPTPRGVIAYVNGVASIWNQWGDQIPAPHIGLYVLQKTVIERNASILRSGALVSPRKARVLVGEDWSRSLAALHFNVEREHAYQVLLGNDIERCAIGEDHAAFAKLATSNGFAEVFPDIVVERLQQWAADGPDVLARLVQNVDQGAVGGEFVPEVWQHIAASLDDLPATEWDGHECRQLATLVRNLPPSDAGRVAEKLIALYGNGRRQFSSDTTLEGQEWFAAFESLWQALKESAGEEAAERFVARTDMLSGPNVCLGVCAAAGDHDTIDFNKFGRTETVTSLTKPLLQLVASEPQIVPRIFRYTPSFASKALFEQVNDRACARLQHERCEKDVLESLVQIVSGIRAEDQRTNDTKTRVSQAIADGSLVVQAMSAKEKGDSKTAGSLLWLIVDSVATHSPNNPGNHNHFGDLNLPFRDFGNFVANIEEDQVALQEVARLVSETSTFNEWLGYAAANRKAEFFKKIIREVVRAGQITRLNVKETVKAFPQIEEILGDPLRDVFVKKLGGWGKHLSDSFPNEEALDVPEPLVRSIARIKASGYEKLGERIDQTLDALSESEWTDVIAGKNEKVLKLAVARIATSGYKPPTEAFSGALSGQLLSILDGHSGSAFDSDIWATLFDGLQPNRRTKLARDLLVEMQNITTNSQTVENFVLACPSFASELPLSERPDIAIDQFVIPLLNSGLREATIFLRNVPKSSRSSFSCRAA